MPSGIDLIIADHEMVDALFDQFEETGEGFLIGQVMNMLQEHDNAEHAALYPLAGRVLGDATLIERAALAHSALTKQMEWMMALEGEPLARAFTELRALVREHVADEQRNLLPKLAQRATPEQLEVLAARILEVKQRVG